MQFARFFFFLHLTSGRSYLAFLLLLCHLYVAWMCLDGYVCLQTLHECEIFLNQHEQTVRKDSIPPDTSSIIDNFHDVFLTSMSDDLHTPVVLAGLSDPLKSINDLLHTRKVWYFLMCTGIGVDLLM